MPTFIETTTGAVAYDIENAQEGSETIIMLPSGAHDRHDFDELRKRLPESLRTIALDWPSHGESPPGEGPLTAMRIADIVEQVAEGLAPEGAIVLGNSVGGFAAVRLAIRRPELVKGLVIVDGGGFAGRSPAVRMFCALMSKRHFLRAIYPAFSSRYMRCKTEADRRARDAGIKTTREDPGLKAMTELWRSFASTEHDLRAEAHTITAPTLLIWGRHDPVIPLRVGKKIQRLIRGSKLSVFDSGHVPHTADPDRFADELSAFVETTCGER